jgi:hypothetical protein
VTAAALTHAAPTATAPTATAPTAGRATAACLFTHPLHGVPLYRTPTGRLLAPTDLTVRIVDGQPELDLTGRQIDPRTLDPAQPENRISCPVLIELAPAWLIAAITTAAITAVSTALTTTRGGRDV